MKTRGRHKQAETENAIVNASEDPSFPVIPQDAPPPTVPHEIQAPTVKTRKKAKPRQFSIDEGLEQPVEQHIFVDPSPPPVQDPRIPRGMRPALRTHPNPRQQAPSKVVTFATEPKQNTGPAGAFETTRVSSPPLLDTPKLSGQAANTPSVDITTPSQMPAGPSQVEALTTTDVGTASIVTPQACSLTLNSANSGPTSPEQTQVRSVLDDTTSPDFRADPPASSSPPPMNPLDAVAPSSLTSPRTSGSRNIFPNTTSLPTSHYTRMVGDLLQQTTAGRVPSLSPPSSPHSGGVSDNDARLHQGPFVFGQSTMSNASPSPLRKNSEQSPIGARMQNGDWDGFEEQFASFSINRSLAGSDDEFVDSEGDEDQETTGDMAAVRRSPKRHENSGMTDFLSGRKKLEELSLAEKIQIADSLTAKFSSTRRKDVKGRLAELMSDPEVSMGVLRVVVQRQNTAPPAPTGRQRAKKAQVEKSKRKEKAPNKVLERPLQIVNSNDVDFSVGDETRESRKEQVDKVSHAQVRDVVDNFLGKRVEMSESGRGKLPSTSNDHTSSVLGSTSGSRAGQFTSSTSRNRIMQQNYEFGNDVASDVASDDRLRYARGYAPDTSPPSDRANGASNTYVEIDNFPPVASSARGAATENSALSARSTSAPSVRFSNVPPARTSNALSSRPNAPINKSLNDPSISRQGSRSGSVFPNGSGNTFAAGSRAPQRGNRVEIVEPPVSEDDMAINVKRRRKATTRRKAPVRKRGTTSGVNRDGADGEFFEINGQFGDDDDEAEGNNAVGDHQLGYYHGDEKKLITRAIFFMRLFLLNMDAYPEKEKLVKWSDKAFKAACQMVWGANYKDRMPEFTDGISTLLQNEGWGVRGKVKKAAVKLLDRVYSIYPPSNKFTRYPNADQMEMRYIEQRVQMLLGKQTLYIRGYVEGHGDDVPYAHPAIKELIHVLVFSKKACKRPLAEQDLDAFNPIPLPLIAYACTALLNGLEEYRTGRHTKKDFSEASYDNYYSVILNNLTEMEGCEESGPILKQIRDDIFDSGCALLDKSLYDEYDRPPAPFVPRQRDNFSNTSNTDFFLQD